LKLQKLLAKSIDLDELCMNKPPRKPKEFHPWETWETLEEVDYLMKDSPGWESHNWQCLKTRKPRSNPMHIMKNPRNHIFKNGRSTKV